MNKYEYWIKHPEVFFKNEEDETYFTQAEVLLGLEPTFCNLKLDKDILIEHIIRKTADEFEFQEELIKRMNVYIYYHDILVEEKLSLEFDHEMNDMRAEESDKIRSAIQSHCDHHWGYKEWVDSCFYKCTCTKCGKVETFYERD